MRRLLCILLCVVMLFSTFALTAYADSELTAWDFILSAYSDIYYTNNVASDPDKLVDFWDSNPGKAVTLYKLFVPTTGATVIPSIMAAKDLNEASDARYMVAQLRKEQVEGLYDGFNDYWFNDGAEIRNLSLSDDLDLTFDSSIKVHGAAGYISGTGPAVCRGNPLVDDSIDVIYYNPPSSYDSYSIYVYNGNGYYFSVIYISTINTVFQGGKALQPGYYIVLNNFELLSIGRTDVDKQMFMRYTTNSNNDVNLLRCYRGSSSIGVSLYSSGTSHSVGYSSSGSVTYDFSYEDILRKLNTAVGIHVTTNDTVDSLSIRPPENVPYDDDDNVVMMLPVDEPGEPVFMSPTVYNNYVDNGNVYNTDDHSNNVVNGDTVSNITNIYNTYITNNNSGGTYDDTKLQDKLDVIIDKLEKIYNAIKNFEFKMPKLSEVEPDYDNFSDCITDNVPIAKDISDLLESMRTDEAKTGFEKEEKSLAGSSTQGKEASIYDGLGVDVSWYDPYREEIRNLLKLFCYVLGLGGIWSAVRSVFGIHSSGGDDD